MSNSTIWWAKRISEGAIGVGSLSTVHHKATTGKWYDDDQDVCHGKVGLLTAGIGSAVRVGLEILGGGGESESRV